jgi:hypothetical protein
MKITALIIAASAALAPMQAYASTGSDHSPVVQLQNAQPQPQVAWGGGDDDDGQCEGLINVCITL